MDVGEEICGEWLRHVKKCEFVQYNTRMENVQGEIDVIGIHLRERIIYACEVAVHLVTGLQYVNNGRPNNVPRLVSKFRKDFQYLEMNFPEYEKVLMFWSPIVRNQKTGSKYNQMEDVQSVVETIQKEYGITIQTMVNESFREALDSLRKVAKRETKVFSASVMRYLQIEGYLGSHLQRLEI